MLRVFTAFSGYDSQCLALNREFRIRKLTEREVLVAIFNQLFSENKTTDKQLKLF